MNADNLEIAKKIIDSNNKAKYGYADHIYDVISMVRVSAYALGCFYRNASTEINLMDIQRSLIVASDTLENGVTGELIELLEEITD